MAQPNTETLTITIKNAGDQYTIEAEGAEGIWADPQPFPARQDLLSETQEATLMEMGEDDSKAEPEAIQQLGRTLFQAIFSQPSILRAFSKVEGRAQLQGNRIRLCLKIGPPELVALPWEAMHDGIDWFLMRKNIALVRRLPQRIEFSPNFQVAGPLKILFIGGVSPSVLPNLDRNIERLAEDLRESLTKDIEAQRVVFKAVLKASLKDLQTELPQDYHIVCFAGHGEPDGIYLRAEYDEYVRLSAKDLAEKGLLARDSVRVVFLAACKTAVPAQETQESFAQTLIKEANLPAVVAMQSYVSIGKAAPLVRQFFTSLSAGQPADVALAEARRTILGREGVVPDVVAPVMYLQTGRPRVFDIAPMSEEQVRAQSALLYQEAQVAIGQEDWATAIEKLQTVFELTPDFIGVADQLQHAQQQRELATHRAQKQDNQPVIVQHEALEESDQKPTSGKKESGSVISFFGRIIRLVSNQPNPWIRIGVPLGIGLLVIVVAILFVWRGLPAWISPPATCVGMPSTHLRVGGYAYVNLDPPVFNTLWSGTGSNHNKIAEIQIGEPVKILKGPKCVRNMLFWEVSVIETDKTGWTAEIGQKNDQYIYWLVPCPSESECGNLLQTFKEVGLTYYQKGDYPNALTIFDRALELYPVDAEVYHYRAHIYLAMGNYSYALADFYDVIKLDPTFRHPYYNLGTVYYEMREYRSAIDAFTRELELEGASDAYFWRGKSYQALEDIQEARANFEYISDADPRAKSALDELNAAISFTSTLTATPASMLTIDYEEHEPNDDFNSTNIIAAGVSYTPTFVPRNGARVDVDYFEMKVYPERLVSCEAKAVDHGVDPRIEFYTKPGEKYNPKLDEYITDFDPNSQKSYSRHSFTPFYEGYLYIRVSQGDDPKAFKGKYTLQCLYFLPTSSTSDTISSVRTYIVGPGDSLYSISKRYGVSVDELKQANNVISDRLTVGQQLIIPQN